jgi:SAM-dependent methyltransferase
LQEWYRTPVGGLFRAGEAALVADILPILFGYHLIGLGVPVAWEPLAASPIAHRCCCDRLPDGDPAVNLIADPTALPIATDSVDVVLLSHVLEFVTQPSAVLREVDRVLIPEGHVLILGFNPFSVWGLWRVLGSHRRAPPCDGVWLSALQLQDRLNRLGFETLAVHYEFYRPPLPRLGWLEQLGQRYWRQGGGGYVLLARKRVIPLTLIKPRWRSQRPSLEAGLINHRAAERQAAGGVEGGAESDD